MHRSWLLVLVLAWLIIWAGAFGLTACGDDDDDETVDDDQVDDDAVDDDVVDDDVVDDDAVDDDAVDDDIVDDDAVDDDIADDDTAPLEPLDLADPMVGTGGIGYGYASAYPGPQTPYGLMQLSPDSSLVGTAFSFMHFSGYYYYDTQIRGFSHLHLHGTGGNDGGALLLMPTSSMPATPIKEKRYRSRFSHDGEMAAPGYYAVDLLDNDVYAELTTADYAALHRYTYAEKGTPHVLVNPGHSIGPDWVKGATIHIRPGDRMVTGMIDFWGPMSGRDGGVLVYYAVKFAEPFAAFGTWKDGQPTANNTDEAGIDIGGYFAFSEQRADPLVVGVGISFQSEEQAEANLADQSYALDFEAMLAAAEDRWREQLGQIEVAGGSLEQQRIFYSSLYHVYKMPHDWTEANNQYFGFDQAPHDAGERRYYTTFSLWDTFRTEHPLLFLLDPEGSTDMMESMVLMTEQGGRGVPQWPLYDGYTGCMIGTSADILFAEAYLKGLQDWRYETAYDYCYEHATGPAEHGRDGIEEYLTLGWVCEDLNNRGASLSLEYCYDDAALSWWADAMGLTADAEMFLEQSQNYRNHWDENVQFMRGRNCDGSWIDPLMPRWPWNEQYVEGNSWHWTFYVPHDVAGLADLFGSEEALVDKLNFAFEKEASQAENNWLPDIYFWHGNEMSMYHAYMFNHLDRPELAQKWARWIMEIKYKATPDGWDGNDDGGTLAAWYIFSALGFFPLAGSDQYTIGSPIFDEATLHLAGGDLVVTAEDNSPDNVYVQSVELNGEPLTEPFFTHDQIVNGGTLAFEMGPEPSNWGTRR